MDPGSKTPGVCMAEPDFLPQNAAASGGTPCGTRSSGTETDEDHHRGLKPSEASAPRCPSGLSWCQHLPLGRGLEMGNGRYHVPSAMCHHNLLGDDALGALTPSPSLDIQALDIHAFAHLP